MTVIDVPAVRKRGGAPGAPPAAASPLLGRPAPARVAPCAAVRGFIN